MADIDFGVKLEPAQRRSGNGIFDSSSALASSLEQRDSMNSKLMVSSSSDRQSSRNVATGTRVAQTSRDAFARVGDQLIDFILAEIRCRAPSPTAARVRLFLSERPISSEQIFFQQLGRFGRQRGKTQRHDMRRQIMGAKNVAEKLVGGRRRRRHRQASSRYSAGLANSSVACSKYLTIVLRGDHGHLRC